MIFLSPFLDFTRMSISIIFFLTHLPIEWFPLAYDLNGFKSRVQGFFQALLLTSVFNEGLSCGCRPQPIAHQQVGPLQLEVQGEPGSFEYFNNHRFSNSLSMHHLVTWSFPLLGLFLSTKTCMVALSPHHLPPHTKWQHQMASCVNITNFFLNVMYLHLLCLHALPKC